MKIKINNYLIIIVFALLILNCLIFTLKADEEIDLYKDDFEISIHTDLMEYEKGQEIYIYGDILSFNNSTNYSEVLLTIGQADWNRNIEIPIVNDSYKYNYSITFGDPEGIWNISVKLLDTEQNIIQNHTNVQISLPSDIVRYKVLWYSPLENAVYMRGSTIDISVLVTENGKSVVNASTINMYHK